MSEYPERAQDDTNLTSKQVTPRSLICRTLVTFQVSVFHLHTKARRGEDFVRVRGGVVLEMVYRVFSSFGWKLHDVLAGRRARSE